MAGRALVFSNPEIIQMLKSRFVSYAGDQWYLHRQQDGDGAFFWKVVQQGYRRDAPRGETRQGVYAATPDGVLLGSDHFHPSSERFLALLRNSLARREKLPQSATVATASQADPQYDRKPPEDGLILNVFSRIPLAPPPGKTWTANMATGRDHLWLTQAEMKALLPPQWRDGLRYPAPAFFTRRLARFHLLDNVRGEPTAWTQPDVREAGIMLVVEDAAAARIRLEGTARMQHTQERGYDARLQGELTFDRRQNRFTRCDILAWGEAWGVAAYTGGAPPGRFPLVIALSLAGASPADRVPPQASRNYRAYFGQSE